MKRSATWFLAPAVLHLAVFGLYPVLYTLWVSLHDWQILRGPMPFVGFGKFAEVSADASFWSALGNSAKFAAMSVPSGVALALLVALLVSDPVRSMAVFRTLYYVPAVSSMVAVSMLWIYVFLPQTGLINSVSALFGLQSVDFLNTPSVALPALAFMSMWTGLGPRMVVYVAAILGLPQSILEAADLDGATQWAKFWSVTFPMLGPTHLFVVLTGTIGALQLFTPIYMMTRGGPGATTDVVGYHIYIEAWQKFDVSAAAAQSVVLLAVTALLAWMQFRLFRAASSGAGIA